MDFTKQYPAPSTCADDVVFEIESISLRLGLSVVDLMNLSRSGDRQSAENLSARSGVPTEEVVSLLQNAKSYFIKKLKPNPHPLINYIPTGLSRLDNSLLGGIPLGQVTEVFGASGCGKSQFLLHLAVKAQLLDKRENNTCIFISTETVLESRRLSDFSKDTPCALDNISYIYCPDLEQQDHILFTQLRLKLEEDISDKKVPRLVVIDSIAHHLRTEDSHLNTSSFFRSHLAWQEQHLSGVPMYNQEKTKFDQVTNRFLKSDPWFKNWTSRKYYLFTLYSHLTELARTFNVAVVLANQVSDVMDPVDESSIDGFRNPEIDDPLVFHNQVGTFSGWNSSSSGPGCDALLLEPGYGPDIYGVESFKTPTQQGSKRKTENIDAQQTHLRDQQYENILSAKEPKRILPAMGYAWSKLVANRILLWKNYSAQFNSTDDTALTNFFGKEKRYEEKSQAIRNPESMEIEAPKTVITSARVVSGYKVRRFARVVSYSTSNGVDTAEFEISHGGIFEVQENIMPTARR